MSLKKPTITDKHVRHFHAEMLIFLTYTHEVVDVLEEE